MDKKSSAYYQREFRKRLREQGLVKKEVWVRPEHVRRLTQVERELRELSNQQRDGVLGGAKTMSEDRLWTTTELYKALQLAELVAKGYADVELIEGVDPSIRITMHEYGDLPLFITVSGEQVIVDSILWSARAVKEVAQFNDVVLRTQRLFPLSNISLATSPEGEDYYQMFGALSARSSLSNVVFEIEVLADNVINVTEAYGQYIQPYSDTEEKVA